MPKRKPLRRIQPWERLPMHHAEEVGGDMEVALVETQGGDFKIQTRAHEYPLDAEEPEVHIEAENVFVIQKAQIKPDDIKRLSSLDAAGIRGGIHSKRTYLMALKDGSLWIWKQTGVEERDEIFVYQLALKMFHAIVPEVQPVFVPKLGWGSAMRKVAGIPAGRVDGLHGYFHGNDEMQADLVAMLVLDYLTGNPDRHANNWFIMHNDRLAAIDNGWAGEDPTMTLNAVFEPARLAGLIRDESLWGGMLKMMLALINDLSGRGDEARALAEEIAIDRKEAMDMLRLWEPKLQKLARFIQVEASKLTKEKVYIHPGEQPPLGVHVEEGPRGGHYYESEGIPIATDKPRGWGKEEDPATIAEWARRHGAEAEEEEGIPSFEDFGGDLDELYKWVEETIDDGTKVQEFFARMYETEVTRVEITRFSADEDEIDIAVKLFDPETDEPLGNLSRTLSKNGEVHHDAFVINSAKQGQGIALAVNRQAEESYREMGFYGVSLSADISIGKYAWAQQGYNFADEYEKSSAWEKLIEFQWENGAYERWAEERETQVEAAYNEDTAEIERTYLEALREDGDKEEAQAQWLSDGRLADDRRTNDLQEISEQANTPPQEFVEEKQQEQYEQGYDAWELAALDDGEKYGGYPLGKAFMLSDYMEEWRAYKDLDPDSTHARVGDVYWDKKKHKIKGKEKRAEEATARQRATDRAAWVKEVLEPVSLKVRAAIRRENNKAGANATAIRATYPDYGKLTPAQQKRHRKANEVITEAQERTRWLWERYEQWAKEKAIDAGYPEAAHTEEEQQQVAAMRKAKEKRIPVELPAGSKVREGVTDEGVWDIDEDTDREWREEVRRLKMEQVTETVLKARTYVETPEEAPQGAQVETGPRGGLYYEGEPVFPGFERPQEHHAGAALLNDEAVVLSGQQSDIFIMALEDLADASEFASVRHISRDDGPTRSAMKARVANVIAQRVGEDLAPPPGIDAPTYVSKMMSSWASSSSDDNDDSIAMQLAAAELFDVRSTPYIAEHYRAQYFKEHEIGQMHLARAKLIVQAMYDETQKFFKKNDIQELVLFRGMRWIDGSEPAEVQDVAWRAPAADTRELMPGLRTSEIALHANPLSSWSYEPDEAVTFANYKPDVEGTDYEGVGGYNLDDPVFIDQAEEALEEEAKEANVDVDDVAAYTAWKDEYLADKGYHDVAQWAYSYMDIEPPQMEPPALRAVMVSRVPVRKIMATAMTGLGCLAESEVVALGGDDFPTHIYTGRSPDTSDVGLPSFRDIVVAERDYAKAQTPEALEAERAKKEFSAWADANLSDMLQQRVHAVNRAVDAVLGKVKPLIKKIDELQVQMHKEPTLIGYERVASSIRGLNAQRDAIISQATNEAEEPFRIKAAQAIEEAGFEVPEGWKPRGPVEKALAKAMKARTYLQPGQQAPAGTQEEEGPRGGRYYESEGRGAAE